MRADADLIKRITGGAVKVEETSKGLLFHRFSEEQRAVYDSNPPFRQKTYADSGIRMEFVTDAESLRLRGGAEKSSSRYFYYFDATVDGVLVAHTGCESCLEDPEFDFDIPLGGGKQRKHVTLYFPCLTRIELGELEFAGATAVEPVKRGRRLLCLGDSITQGYDSRYPSLAYTNRIADMLGAEVVNKAIGGDRFNPALAALPDETGYDLITVGYGTNDWRHHTREKLQNDSREFFANLRSSYPHTPIAAILPIWRHNWDLVTEAGTFAEATRIIREAAGMIDNVTVIDGTTLTPHLKSFYSDGLHPNEFGFMFYTENLYRALPEQLK